MPKSILRVYLDYYFKFSKIPLKKIVLLLTQHYKLKKPIHRGQVTCPRLQSQKFLGEEVGKLNFTSECW